MLLLEEITVYPLTEAATPGYGSPERTKGTAEILPASVQPSKADEDEEGRDTFTNEYEVTTVPSEALTGTSEVVWNGDNYEVVGDPQKFTHAMGEQHLELVIRRIEG